MLPKFSVKKPYTVFVAVILILVLGAISFINLQTDLLPSIDLPYLVVMTPYPGASPEEVELVVTRPLEQILATTSNIKNVSSISNENTSIIILEFENRVNMDSAVIEVNGNLDLVKPNWEDEVGTPTIIRMNPDMLPIMVSSVDIEGLDAAELSKKVKDVIILELESVEGVASVTAEGLVEKSIKVKIQPDKIERLNKAILESIDSELSKAEDELKKAKAEVEKGLSQLEAEEEKQKQDLAKGENAILEAKTELEKADQGLKQAEDDLLNRKNQVQSMVSLLDRVLSGDVQLDEALRFMPEEQRKELEGVISQGLDGVVAKRDEYQLALASIQTGLEEINLQKSALATQKHELAKKEEELSQGKELMASGMDKAREELIKGKNTIESNLDELKDAKEKAFQEADLEGVINEEMVAGILAAQNFSMPAGYISQDGVDYLVKVGDRIHSREELADLLLFDTKVEGVGKIYLRDVADVVKEDNAQELYAKVNGKDAVILSFQKQSNYATAEVTQSIRDKMEEMIAKYDGLSITNLMDQGTYINIVVDSVMSNLLYGGGLAILILLVFLRDIKPTFIVALSIPISLVFAIAMMYFTGVTINIISLGGLALGVGMLVDNSIVVIENIYRLKNEGRSSLEASIEGAKQVSGAISASTLTTMVVFLPVVFTDGLSRQIFTDMGLTIAYSLLASLIIALTVVPVMSSTVFKKLVDREHGLFDRFVSSYGKLLQKSLAHKPLVILLVVGLLSVSIYSAFSMGAIFIPEIDGNEMAVTIEMDRESTFEEITQITDRVVDRIMGIQDIETIGAFLGTSMMGMGGDRGQNASLYLILNEDRTMTNKEIQGEIKDRTEDLDVDITINTGMDIGVIAGDGIQVNIKGNAMDILRDISHDILQLLEETEGVTAVETGFEENAIEVRLTVDKERAMEKGLTVAQIFGEVSRQVDEGKRATTINMDNKDYPVIVLNTHKRSITKENLEDLEIPIERDGEKENIRIGDIVEIEEVQGPSSIRRDGQERYVSVTAHVDLDHNIGLVSRDFESKLAAYEVPEGYRIELTGENETINTTLRDLIYMILLAILFIYLIMVAQFQSFLSPFIVMFTIPLAFTGGFLALLITGNEISMISMLGFLVLSGVVVNNGIVFVDFTNQLLDGGMSKREALIHAGKVRIRPILMTAITTILGLSTLSFGVGMGAEALQPLAIVAIGGLTYATLLTLIFVPVMYDILVRVKKEH